MATPHFENNFPGILSELSLGAYVSNLNHVSLAFVAVLLNEAKILRPRPRPRPGPRGRAQGPEAETEARALRSRSRPISWLRGQAEAKDKVRNKKYQMMVDNIQANLYQCDQNDTV